MKRRNKILSTFLLTAALLFSAFSLTSCEGKDGEDFNLYAVYQQLVTDGEYSGTYTEFLKEYLNVNMKQENASSLSATINTTLSSVVSVEMICEYKYTSYMSSVGIRPTTQTETLAFYGSGVIYQLDKEKGDAYIVTNAHVIYDGTFVQNNVTYTPTGKPEYNVYLYGLEYADYAIDATLVGYSVNNDVAVLKIEDSEVLKDSFSQAVTVGDSDKVAVGDELFLLGNALGEGLSATRGIISVEREDVELYAADGVTVLSLSAFRTDAAANHGNSGGGMFDANGKLIGILFAGNSDDGTQNVANSLPVNTVVNIADSILDNCNGSSVLTTTKAQLGITVYTESIKQVYDDETNKLSAEESIVVESVTASAAAGGILKKNDKIISLSLGDDSVEIKRQWQMSDFLWKIRSGDTLGVTVERNGERTTLQISFADDNFVSVS